MIASYYRVEFNRKAATQGAKRFEAKTTASVYYLPIVFRLKT